jgi:hypothetical protein
MKKSTAVHFAIIISVVLFSCHSINQNNALQTDSASKSVVINPANTVPEFRKFVKAEPVAEYKEKTDNPLNDWYFSVKLFETEKTFNYLMKLQFEEITGEDTLRLPNFGNEPKPVTQKGKDKYSCIVGFMDNENKFREYKLVHVENNNHLKVTSLKHYSITASPN